MLFIQDPDAILDYTVRWAAWLSGDTIATATATADTGITVGAVTNDGTTVVVWLSGGTVGTTYTVTVRITTNGGRTDERSFTVTIRDR